MDEGKEKENKKKRVTAIALAVAAFTVCPLGFFVFMGVGHSSYAEDQLAFLCCPVGTVLLIVVACGLELSIKK